MDANDLITRRHYLDSSDQPLYVLFKYLGPRRSTLRFVRPNDLESNDLTDLETTVFKLAAQYAGVVRLQEVDGGRFIVEFEQLPKAVTDEAGKPKRYPLNDYYRTLKSAPGPARPIPSSAQAVRSPIVNRATWSASDLI